MGRNMKVMVASHKAYRMPQDGMYFPVQVGAEGKQLDLGWQRDDEGENISTMNPRFCELTAMYWAWKNLDADYIGLAHYRRHFTTKGVAGRIGRDKFDCVLTSGELAGLLAEYDVIVPNKRRYFIETMESHFLHLPYTFEKDYSTWEGTLKAMHPDYSGAFDAVMARSWAHMFNMFIMERELFDAYCGWMFPVLLAVDRKIDVTGYTPMEARAMSYFGEFMLDIWLEKNPQRVREVDVMFMERQNLAMKYMTFVFRKYAGGGTFVDDDSCENRGIVMPHAIRRSGVACS